MNKDFRYGLALLRSLAIIAVFIYHYSDNILKEGYA